MNGATNGIGSAAGGSNGIAGAGAMGPMNAGQQMDVNFLWQKVLELSEVLRENRERTRGVVEGAEELAVSYISFLNIYHAKADEGARNALEDSATLLCLNL